MDFKIPSLKGSVDFELNEFSGIITKIEKWQTTTVTTTTRVSGGGSRIVEDLGGALWIKNTKPTVSVNHHTHHSMNTRIYHGNGAYCTLNRDFIAKEGDTLKTLWFKNAKKDILYGVREKETGDWEPMTSFKVYSKKVLGIKFIGFWRYIIPLILLGICLFGVFLLEQYAISQKIPVGDSSKVYNPILFLIAFPSFGILKNLTKLLFFRKRIVLRKDYRVVQEKIKEIFRSFALD